jgi:hypothetical protein
MNQNTSSKERSISQKSLVRSCELRLEKRTTVPGGKERVEFICGASGGLEQGYVLGVDGEDISSMIAICTACPIPNVLASKRSCLNLVPIRRFPNGTRSLPVLQGQGQSVHRNESVDAFFPCRWFYPLYQQNQPRDTVVCQSCSHWFPRPPLERIPDYWSETQKMLGVVNGEELTSRPPTWFAPAPRGTSNTTWWQKLLQKIGL